jgi:hypothetical protein
MIFREIRRGTGRGDRDGAVVPATRRASRAQSDGSAQSEADDATASVFLRAVTRLALENDSSGTHECGGGESEKRKGPPKTSAGLSFW